MSTVPSVEIPAEMPPPSTHWSRIGSLILGSTSWSRRTLLTALNVPPFTLLAPDIDEAAIERETPEALVLAIGHAKATALLGSRAPPLAPRGRTLLICGDSVVTHKGHVLGKPADPAEARSWLQSYATAPATTVSSVVVVDVATGLRWDGVDEAEVYFRELPNAVVDELVETGGAMESAGGLRIEHPSVKQYTECIVGHYSAVMGFSQPLVISLLGMAMDGKGGKVHS